MLNDVVCIASGRDYQHQIFIESYARVVMHEPAYFYVGNFAARRCFRRIVNRLRLRDPSIELQREFGFIQQNNPGRSALDIDLMMYYGV